MEYAHLSKIKITIYGEHMALHSKFTQNNGSNGFCKFSLNTLSINLYIAKQPNRDGW